MISPNELQKAMKRFGIQQHDLDALRVIIEFKDKELVFEKPNVAKVSMMGQESFQVVGSFVERQKNAFSEEDVRTVVSQAGVEEDAAKKSLEKHKGDLAAAILELTNGK